MADAIKKDKQAKPDKSLDRRTFLAASAGLAALTTACESPDGQPKMPAAG